MRKVRKILKHFYNISIYDLVIWLEYGTTN